MDLNILYEDNHLIAVEKLPGVLTQPASLNLPVLLDEVKDYIKIKYNKPGNVFVGMVHRLDTNVGGIVVFAKTSKGASRISEEIRQNRFEKRYLAIVEGNVDKEEATLTDYLMKDNANRRAVITNSKTGKESILKYKKLAQIDNLTLLEINLITGRFHQIRAQLANQGTPIYGDYKYGSSKNINNIALYAHYLNFKHPTKDEVITITNLPKDKIYQPFLLKAGLI